MRGGVLYTKEDDVVNGILTVARDMARRCGMEEDSIWQELENECIADMPAVEV